MFATYYKNYGNGLIKCHLELLKNSKPGSKTFPWNLVLCYNEKHSAFVSQPRERGQVAGGRGRDTAGLVGGNILHFTSSR